MSFIADLARLGILPLQHHDEAGPHAVPPEVRTTLYGVRVVGRDPVRAYYLRDDDTYGPVHGGAVWLSAHASPDGTGPTRNVPLWGQAFAARTDTMDNAPGAEKYGFKADTPTVAVPGFRQADDGDGWTDDQSLVPQPVTTPVGMGDLPANMPGVVVPLTTTDEQQVAFVPAGHVLVAVHRGGDGKFGSYVYDTTKDGKLDETRRARLHSLTRVYKLPKGAALPFGGKGKSCGLAWQLGLDVDGEAGNGLVADEGAPAATPAATSQRTATGMSAQGTQERPGTGKDGAVPPVGGWPAGTVNVPPGTPADLQIKGIWVNPNQPAGAVPGVPKTQDRGSAKKAPPQVLAVATRRGYGTHHAGSGQDVHRVGTTPDGEVVNSLHFNPDAAWHHPLGDAPFEFDGTPWVPPAPDGPLIQKVYLRFDGSDLHSWLTGTKPGKWKWETQTYVDEPDDPGTDDPGGGDGEDPPPPGTDDPGGGGRRRKYPKRPGGGTGTGWLPGGDGWTGGGGGDYGVPYGDPRRGWTGGGWAGGGGKGGGYLPGGGGGTGGGYLPGGGNTGGTGTGSTWQPPRRPRVGGRTQGWLPGPENMLWPNGDGLNTGYMPGGDNVPPPTDGSVASGPDGGAYPATGMSAGYALGARVGATRRVYARTPYEFAVPALLARPALLSTQGSDWRYGGMGAASWAAYDRAPVAGKLEAYGNQDGGGWQYQGAPGQALYRRGTLTRGGFGLVPANTSLDDVIAGRPLPSSMPETWLMATTTAAGFALADPLRSGKPANGYAWSRGDSTSTSIDYVDGSGAYPLPSALYLTATNPEVPSAQLWGYEALTTRGSANGKVPVADGSYGYSWADPATLVSGGTVDPRTNGFRLNLTNEPVGIADADDLGTIYMIPYRGDVIALWSGSAWVLLQSAQVAINITATSGKVYDVFAYNNAGTLTLELSAAWTNSTTRANAVVWLNGVLVKSADHTRRLVGTFYATATDKTSDSSKAAYGRMLWNADNRVRKSCVVKETTDSWSEGPAVAWAQVHGELGTANYVASLTGWSEDQVEAQATLMASDPDGGGLISTGVGIDSTSTNSAQVLGATTLSSTTGIQAATCSYRGWPGLGYRKLNWLQYVRTDLGFTVTLYGDDNAPTVFQSGMVVDVWV